MIFVPILNNVGIQIKALLLTSVKLLFVTGKIICCEIPCFRTTHKIVCSESMKPELYNSYAPT